MHIPITKKQHERLYLSVQRTLLYGSNLFGTATENSDIDLLCIYDWSSVFGDKPKPVLNEHGFTYSCELTNTDYLYMTEELYTKELYSGNGTITLDTFILNKPHSEFNYTFKTIKAYLGIAKRDIKFYTIDKKKFNVIRCLVIAEHIFEKKDLYITDIIKEVNSRMTTDFNTCNELIKMYNTKLSDLLDKNLINLYHIEESTDELYNLMINENNIKSRKF